MRDNPMGRKRGFAEDGADEGGAGPGLFELKPPPDENAGHRQRLRDRFRQGGADAIPDYELLELILFRAIPRQDTKPIAKQLIARFGSFAEVINAPDTRLKEVSGVSECKPRKGYIAIESEGAECHFRDFKFKELPSTNPKPDEIATARIGHVSLFDHVNLKPWNCKEGTWVVAGETLTCKGGDDLSRKIESKKCEVLFDWKLPAKSAAKCEVRIGDDARFAEQAKGAKIGEWNRAVFEFDPQGPGVALKFLPAEGLQLRNLYLRELK